MKDLTIVILLFVIAELIWTLIFMPDRKSPPVDLEKIFGFVNRKNLVDRLKLEINRWNIRHRMYWFRGW